MADLTDDPNERVQYRGVTQAESIDGCALSTSPTELARMLAESCEWRTDTYTGQVYDENGKLLGATECLSGTILRTDMHNRARMCA